MKSTPAIARLAAQSAPSPGVSFVIPVRNGAPWLERVLGAIANARYTGPVEIIAVEDGSADESPVILARHADVTVIDGPRRGAAAAINTGIGAATHALIAQIDQDVVIAPDWIECLVRCLDDPGVAAAQGHYVAADDAGFWSRVMALDLRERYSKLGARTNHVCTGNSIYRKDALVRIGLFDAGLGYGYDNDASYRLTAAGYALAFCADATSTHYWREGLLPYARQQYGFGYGRLDLVAKHRGRLGGDDVSGAVMMSHGLLMTGAIGLLLVALPLQLAGGPGRILALAGAVLVAALAAERFVTGVRAVARFHDRAGFWFVPAHLTRDVAWTTAIVTWCTRRALQLRPQPSDSMEPRR